MNIAVNHSTSHEKTLIWAIICSVLLHGLFIIMVPNIKFDEIKMPETLTVDFVKIPEPPPVVIPEPVQPPPEVVKPKIEPKIKPTPKPIIKPQPAPVIEKTEVAPEPPPPAQPTEVIAVAPEVNTAPPVETVPAPIPVKEQPPPPPPAPSQADIDDAKGRYGNSLWGAISKHKNYPKIARMRNWTGEAIVELALDGNGKLKSKKIVQSSGHDVLDRQALEMVEKALPFPAPPEALRGTNFTITVPVPFKLE